MSIVPWKVAPVLKKLFAEQPPALLSHYTDQHGMLGILKNRQLWASNIRFLNDHMEYEWGMNLLLADVIRQKALYADDHERLEHLDAMTHSVDRLFPNTSQYVASWSDTHDDLSQWRGYSGSSTGYEMRMPGATLRELATRQQYNFARCLYDGKEQINAAAEIVSTSLAEMVDDRAADRQYGEHVSSTDKFLLRLLRLAPLFKHTAFAAEREWRLIADFPGVEFAPSFAIRAGRSMPIPYVCFELSMPPVGELPAIPLRIDEITVGPCAEPQRAQQATNAALWHGAMPFDGISRSVSVSQVPYRNW